MLRFYDNQEPLEFGWRLSVAFVKVIEIYGFIDKRSA